MRGGWAGLEEDAVPVVADSRSEELTDGQETPFLPPFLPPSAAWDVLQKLCGLRARATQPPAMFVSLKSSHLGMLGVLKIAGK